MIDLAGLPPINLLQALLSIHISFVNQSNSKGNDCGLEPSCRVKDRKKEMINLPLPGDKKPVVMVGEGSFGYILPNSVTI